MARLTDHPDMTLDVYRGRKTTMQQQQPDMSGGQNFVKTDNVWHRYVLHFFPLILDCTLIVKNLLPLRERFLLVVPSQALGANCIQWNV